MPTVMQASAGAIHAFGDLVRTPPAPAPKRWLCGFDLAFTPPFYRRRSVFCRGSLPVCGAALRGYNRGGHDEVRSGLRPRIDTRSRVAFIRPGKEPSVPRKPIQLANKVESLGILDVDGKLDPGLDPRLDQDLLKRMFRGMLLARRLDERLLRLQRQGRIGTFGPAMGQEAASLGPAVAMEASDWFVPSFREPAGMLWRGWPIEKIILWWAGHEYGASPPQGHNDLPICVPVVTQCLHAAGIAWGCHYRQDGAVVVCFLGDGATSEGDFHEALNFACSRDLPVIYIIQNNHWAISLPRARQTKATTLAQKCIAYGCDGIQADGNDILAMYVAAREAIERARAGRGPTLIEAVTYRLAMHTTADDPKKYRTEEEVAAWAAKDPLIRFEKFMRRNSLLDDAALAQLETEIGDQIRGAVESAERYQPDPLDSFHHTFAQMPASLAAQAGEFEEYMNELRAQEEVEAEPPPHPGRSQTTERELAES
jgi:pyruvate dehydrogenase E1 component alpha subunit